MNVPANRLKTRLAASALAIATLAGGGCAQFASSGHNVAGVQLSAQGQQQAALQRFQSALAANPSDPDAYYNAARVYHAMGTQTKDKKYFQEAERLYNRCLDYDRNHVDANRSLAVMLVEDNRADKAFALLQNWAAESPRSADARVELSRLYYEYGDKVAAKQQLDAAMQFEPYNPRIARALGALYEESGQPVQALANYQRSYYGDNLQTDLVPRIASLQGATQTSIGPTPQGTRLVTQPTATSPARY